MKRTPGRVAGAVTRFACGLAMFASPCLAQHPQSGVLVWPPGYESVPGEAAQEAPFTMPSVPSGPATFGTRAATLVRGDSLALPVGTGIRAISFRRDAVFAETYPAILTAQFDLWFGNVDDASRPDAGMRDLWLGDPIRIGFGALSLPTESPRPAVGNTASFDLRVPLQVPWVFDGGDFAFDLAVRAASYGASPARWRRDAVYREPAEGGSFEVVALGCSSSAGFVPSAFVLSPSLYAGGELIVRMHVGPTVPSALQALSHCWLLLGDPASASLPLALVGGPIGCALDVLPMFSVAVPTSDPMRNFSQAEFRAAIPRSTILSTNLAAQWVMLDPAIGSALPLVTSHAISFDIGASATPAGSFGRTFWGYDSTVVGIEYTGWLGPADYVPIVCFEF